MPHSLESLTVDHFESSVGSHFRLQASDTDLDLRLASVQKLGRTQRAGGAFSLVFVSEPGPCLPQMIYRLDNEALGPLDIFLVPIGPVEGGNGYEAVFA